jgi:hypothetical protein
MRVIYHAMGSARWGLDFLMGQPRWGHYALGMTSLSLNAPLRHADELAEGKKISLNAAHVRALRDREIKEKEAFTLVDRKGRFFRASLKVVKKTSGEASSTSEWLS